MNVKKEDSIIKFQSLPRRFYLLRKEDMSGVSGTGVVAFGIEFLNKKCYLSWLGEHPSTVEFSCIEDLIFVHGHDDRTNVVWID